MRPAVLLLLAAAACKFDGGGVGAGDDVPDPDGSVADVDAAPDDPDAMPPPPDAMPPPDQDGDGIADAADNCVAIGNPEQYNEDGDARGDVCDNCPHVDNDGQESGDGDAVGDACDPYPGLAGDAIVLFDGFHGTTRAPAWTAAVGADTWTVGGGALHQTATTREEKILHYSGLTETLVSVDVALTPTTIPDSTDTGDNVRSAGAVTGFSASGVAAGRVAVVADLIRSDNPAYVMTNVLGASADTGNGGWQYFTGALSTGRYLISTSAGSTEQSIAGVEPGGGTAAGSQAATPVAAGVGLRTRNVAVDYEYIVVYGVE
jgi:hypothetical protein